MPPATTHLQPQVPTQHKAPALNTCPCGATPRMWRTTSRFPFYAMCGECHRATPSVRSAAVAAGIWNHNHPEAK